MGAIFPFITSVVCLAFAATVLKQYLDRRKTHQLIWSTSLILFTFAAFCEFYSEVWGWPILLYRLYYVAAASLVAYLGLGTIYLIFKKRTGRIFLGVFVLINIVFLIAALRAPVESSKLIPGITVAGKAMPRAVRLFSPLMTVPGTLALVGGALYSIYLFRKKRELAYRVWANVFIATGAFIIAAAGAIARMGITVWLYPAEMVGIVLMFVGFLRAGTLRSKR